MVSELITCILHFDVTVYRRGLKMAFREVNVPLKFPGTSDELSELGNTVLEGVVYGTYNDVLLGEQDFQIEAVVFIMRGNMMLSFTPQFAGVHTARIFSDGREICKPVVFRVTLGGQAVREDGDKRGTSIRSKTLKIRSISTTFTDDGSEDASVFTQNSTLSRYARSDSEMLKGPRTSRMDSGINLLSPNGTPITIPEEGSLLPSPPIHQHLTTFNDLYSQKYAGVKFAEADIEATRKEVLHASLGPGNMLTTETIKLLEKDATSQMKRMP